MMNKEKNVISQEQKTILEECYREAIIALSQLRTILEEIGVIEEAEDIRTNMS